MEQQERRTVVIGHKNPDTDSICSAISYASLKKAVSGGRYVPGRAGSISRETKFVLDYFGMPEPELIRDVRTQVKDIEIRKTAGVDRNISLKKAWNIMQETGAVTLPVLKENGTLEGLITVGDITKSYMNVYDSSIMSKANTQYANIVETLEGLIIIGSEDNYFNQGKVLIAAANPDMMEYYIEPHDLVILGNRYESQLCAIEMEADCIIVCEGAAVSMTIRKLAQERGCTVMTTPYDAFTAARLINQSMPISYFMKTENLVTFVRDDYIEDIREVMASKRYRDFPVLDKEGKYWGMISRRNLLGARGKQVILVDHNEKSQAVDGVESAEIQEIIDHHKLGTMCSAIISDTLLFRSPTCTAVDKQAALELAEIAGIQIEKYASEMFAAASDLKGKTEAEIFYQDFKRFSAGKKTFGVGQISSVNADELDELKERLIPYARREREDKGMDMMFFMLTNILTESTDLICEGQGSEQMVVSALHGTLDEKYGTVVHLPGVVSRKKQLIPAIMLAVQN